MANAPYSPLGPNTTPEAAAPIEVEPMPDTGVRRVLDAYSERHRQWSRWGAVLAGLFIALASGILLSMLGLAFGLTALNPLGTNAGQSFTIGSAIWWGIQSLIVAFVGGYAAAKLGGSIRRSDGMVSGALTWATLVVATLWLLGNVASTTLMGAVGAASVATNVPGVAPRPGTTAPALRPSEIAAGKSAAAGAMWYSFAITAGSLLAAIAGGSAGSVGGRMARDRWDAHRTERRHEREEERRATGGPSAA